MKTVFLLFDSLNLRMLNSYGGKYLETPNFNRLAKKSIQFKEMYCILNMYYTISFQNRSEVVVVAGRAGAKYAINKYISKHHIHSNFITKNIIDNWLSHKKKAKKWDWVSIEGFRNNA